MVAVKGREAANEPAEATAASAAIPESWRQWDRFLETTPATGFMQSSWWAHFRRFVGFEYFGAVLQENGKAVGGGLVAKVEYDTDGCFYYLQDGPVLPVDEPQASRIFAAMLDYLNQHRRSEPQTISHLRIEPRWEHLPEFVQGFEPPSFSDKFREPRDTLCINLQMSEEAILAQMKPKGRYNIRVAQRHGVQIVEDNSQKGLGDFIRIQRSTANRQDIGTKPSSYFRNLMAVMLPNHKASLFFAEYRGRRIATALVVYFGDRATYFYGGSLVLHRQVMAPYLLHFEIMGKAGAMGYKWYDVWGVAPADEPEHPWQAISVFKRKFGGCEVKLVPTLDLVYNQAAYKRFKRLEAKG